MDRFAEKYDATPFDPDDPFDALGEAARKIVATAFLESLEKVETRNGDELQAVAGGLLIGLIGCLRACAPPSDETDASIRAGLIELTPWAMDMARSVDDLPPLSDGN